MNKILISVFLCLAIVIGCTETEPEPKPKGEEMTSLLIGLIPEHNIFKQLELYEPFADYLSKKIGVKIKLKVHPVWKYY
jgi:ABC-type phosphate/phosphonate transport system substrate-binding protein